MGGFLPLNDKKHPPLQLADMFANSVMGRHRDVLHGLPVDREDVDFITASNIYTWTRDYGFAALRIALLEASLPVPDDIVEASKETWTNTTR